MWRSITNLSSSFSFDTPVLPVLYSTHPPGRTVKSDAIGKAGGRGNHGALKTLVNPWAPEWASFRNFADCPGAYLRPLVYERPDLEQVAR